MTPTSAHRKLRLGRLLSHASWVLPLLGCALALLGSGTPETTFHIELSRKFLLCLFFVPVVSGGCCAVVALSGIFWWGHRYWRIAAVGLAFSILVFWEFTYVIFYFERR